MEWVIANMAPLMFGAMVIFLLFGYPVAFALAANGIVFGLIGIELGLLQPALFQALPERIFGIMARKARCMAEEREWKKTGRARLRNHRQRKHGTRPQQKGAP